MSFQCKLERNNLFQFQYWFLHCWYQLGLFLKLLSHFIEMVGILESIVLFNIISNVRRYFSNLVKEGTKQMSTRISEGKNGVTFPFYKSLTWFCLEKIKNDRIKCEWCHYEEKESGTMQLSDDLADSCFNTFPWNIIFLLKVASNA